METTLAILPAAAQLTTATLFGGSLLFFATFAAFLFRYLSADEAGRLLRAAFPHFYLGTIALALIAGALFLPVDGRSSALLAGAAAITIPVRQLLMPAINRATDRGDKAAFQRLHGLSVAIGLLQLVAFGYILLRHTA